MCCTAAEISDSCLFFFSDALCSFQQHSLCWRYFAIATTRFSDSCGYFLLQRSWFRCMLLATGWISYSCLISPAADEKLIHVSSGCLFFSYCNLNFWQPLACLLQHLLLTAAASFSLPMVGFLRATHCLLVWLLSLWFLTAAGFSLSKEFLITICF